MRKWLSYAYVMVLGLFLMGSCSSETENFLTRKSQDEVQLPPPIFNSINWPNPYTVLSDEGRLAITGNLQCPVGYFTDAPLAVYIFPVSLINPPLPLAPDPPPTYTQLQQILLGNLKVQEWISKIRGEVFNLVTQGPSIPDEFIKGAHCYAVASDSFNQYNYVNFETGDFRIDLDQWARLNTGRKLLIVFGVDRLGQSTIAMNIFDVPVLFPDLLVSLNASSVQFGNRMTSLAAALFDVLSVSGDGRAADITLMQPFFTLASSAYSNGYKITEWDGFTAEFRAQANNASSSIVNPFYRHSYLSKVDSVARIFDLGNWDAVSYQYTELEGENNLYESYLDAHQSTDQMFNEITEQWNVVERGGGVKELAVQVYEGQNLIAQFSVIGDPNAPLLVTGFIGQHTIVPADYNPYILEIFSRFEDERYFWPPYGI